MNQDVNQSTHLDDPPLVDKEVVHQPRAISVATLVNLLEEDIIPHHMGTEHIIHPDLVELNFCCNRWSSSLDR